MINFILFKTNEVALFFKAKALVLSNAEVTWENRVKINIGQEIKDRKIY
jgi:hypothetical protein